MVSEPGTRHYQGIAGRQYHEQKRAIPETALPWVAELRAAKLRPYVSATDVVFEYGVGSGWNLAGLQCKRRLGFDVADFLAPAVRQHGVEFFSDPQAIATESVDVVVCHHALEHVLQPYEALQQMHRVLRSGGKLLVFVPYEREARYTRFDRAEPNHHLYSWNVQTLGNLVEESGFEVVEADAGRFGYDRFAAVWATKLHLGHAGFRLLRQCLHVVRPAFEVRVVARKKRPD